jgi:chorismate mutase
MTNAERRDIRSDIEELDADLIGMVEELREVRERIAAAKVQRAALVAKLKNLKTPATK